MANATTLNLSRFGLGLHGLLQEAPPPPPSMSRSPQRCTVLAGDLEHRDALELALEGQGLQLVAPGQEPIAVITAADL